MFHRILTLSAQRYLGSVGPLPRNKSSSQKDPQTCDLLKTVAKEEPSALVVSVKAGDVCEVTENQSQKMHKDNDQAGNAQKTGLTEISGYGLYVVPQWREPVHRQPWPVYRGPEIKMVPGKDSTDVGVVPSDEKPKLSRRDCLRLMCKEERLKSSKEQKPVADMVPMQEADNSEYVSRFGMSSGPKGKTD